MARATTRERGSDGTTASSRGAGRAPAAAVAVAVTALVVVGAWLAFTAAGSGDEEVSPVEGLVHIHGLEIPSWADGQVFASTHEGAFRIDPDGKWSWVTEQPHDLMGFRAHPTEEGVLYSSGHPAPGSELPNPLGFVVSDDHGATWEPRALQGQVDFHAMAVHPEDGDVIYGYAGNRGLLRSLDGGHQWQAVDAPPVQQAGGVLGLAVGGRTGGQTHVLAGTEGGLFRSRDPGASWESLLDAPVSAVAIDASDPDRVVAYSLEEGQGLVMTTDGGDTWEPLGLELEEDAIGHVALSPEDPETLWAASIGESLWRTTDGGGTWDQLVDAGTRVEA